MRTSSLLLILLRAPFMPRNSYEQDEEAGFLHRDGQLQNAIGLFPEHITTVGFLPASCTEILLMSLP